MSVFISKAADDMDSSTSESSSYSNRRTAYVLVCLTNWSVTTRAHTRAHRTSVVFLWSNHFKVTPPLHPLLLPSLGSSHQVCLMIGLWEFFHFLLSGSGVIRTRLIRRSCHGPTHPAARPITDTRFQSNPSLLLPAADGDL